jgi:biopolymer transport protein ExbB/TolQ
MQTCKVALLQLLVGVAISLLLVFLNYDFLHEFYIDNQETLAGPIINGFILLLFFTGLIRIIQGYGFYSQEETALKQFRKNLTRDIDEPDEGISSKSVIGQRYQRVQQLSRAGTNFDQNALAATLIAQQSLKTSYPHFINNILILAGVFGTIISLSISLVGANEMISNGGSIAGMTTVIHGMSTALSTTMTAIFCYVFFHFFYSKLTDIQTNILSQIEEITQSMLDNRVVDETDVLRSTETLLQQLQSLVTEMKSTQEENSRAAMQLAYLIKISQQSNGSINHHMDRLEGILRDGFRLPPLSNNQGNSK